MVGVSPALCGQAVAHQTGSCTRTSLLDVHPHRRCRPFRKSGRSAENVVCHAKYQVTNHAGNCFTSEHSRPERTSWQLRAIRNSKQAKQAKQDEDGKAKQGDSNIMSQSAGYVSGLMNELLYGAASRMERGQTTCIACKGAGTRVCANCKGQGIMQAKQLQKAKDPVRQAANKVQSMLGGSSSSQYSTALRSNRCPKCHGNGQLVCNNCEGRGFRGDLE